MLIFQGVSEKSPNICMRMLEKIWQNVCLFQHSSLLLQPQKEYRTFSAMFQHLYHPKKSSLQKSYDSDSCICIKPLFHMFHSLYLERSKQIRKILVYISHLNSQSPQKSKSLEKARHFRCTWRWVKKTWPSFWDHRLMLKHRRELL